jgi:hypothetical protein
MSSNGGASELAAAAPSALGVVAIGGFCIGFFSASRAAAPMKGAWLDDGQDGNDDKGSQQDYRKNLPDEHQAHASW